MVRSKLAWSGGVFTVGLAVLGAPAALAEGVLPLGDEFQVNTYTTSSQRRAGVAVDGAGNFVVVWSTNPGFFGRRYDADGQPLGDEFQVNTYTTTGTHTPGVAAASGGDFVVVWDRPDASSNGIFGQRYKADGSPLGGEFQVNTYTTDNQDGPAVAMGAAGDFVVVWTSFSQDGYDRGIFGQRYDADGSPAGAEFQVNTYTTSLQKYPSVAASAVGDFVVVWQSHYQDGDSRGVFAQRYDADGSPLGGEFLVNSTTTGFQAYPGVAVDETNGFVVVWMEGFDGSNTGVRGQRYDSEGNSLGGEFQVNSYTTGYQGQAGRTNTWVGRDAAGNFVVAWRSDNQDGSSRGVFGQLFDVDGATVGLEFRVNSYTTAAQQYPAIAVAPRGQFVVAWESENQDGSSYGVFGQRYVIPIFADGFETGDTSAWTATVP